MKLLSFNAGGRNRIGELVGDTVYSLNWTDTMRQMLRRGLTASRAYERFSVDKVDIHAPLNPGKIVCIGLNYADHARETGREAPDRPLIFAKYPSAVIGQGEAIRWKPSITNAVDYEGELAVVIGKRAKDVSEADAMNYVMGYTIANDVSARDLQHGSDSQWTRGKSLDTFCPLGPVIVTKDEIANPQELSIKTTVNGETMQDGNTRDMVFTIPKLIAYISDNFTLEPGDLILTGTPAGVGHGKQPPRYLQAGDTVSITIEGIGELHNPCQPLEAQA